MPDNSPSRCTIIAVEGPDKAGKTTLVNELNSHIQNAELIHFGSPVKGRKLRDEYAYPLLSAFNPKIFDRWALGEMIYGPMLRGKSELSMLDLKVLFRMFNTYNSIFVLALPPVVRLKGMQLKDDPVTTEQNLQVLHSYNNWVSWLDRHVRNFRVYTAENLEAVRPEVETIFTRLEEQRRQHIYFGPAYGNLTGRYLIIGEAVNKRRTWLDFPFTQGRCSELLADSLERAEIDEKDCFFINSDCLFINYYLEQFKHKAIVCLGKAAAEVAKGYKFYELPHPQYWLRFKYHQLLQYARLLEDVRKEELCKIP